MSEAVDREVELDHSSRKRRSFLFVGRIAFGLAMIGAAAAVVRLAWPATPATQVVQPAVPVVATPVTIRNVPIHLSGMGTVAPLNVVDVKVRVDGQLQSLGFTEGQDVAAGTLLGQIDPRPYQAILDQAQANRQKDMAQLASARREVARAARLAATGAGTTQSLDNMNAQAAALEATVAADGAAIDAARLNLEFTRIESPIAGRLGMRQISPGSIVHASDPSGIVMVTQIAPISVLFSLPQDELNEVAAGQQIGKLPVAVYTRDGTNHIADGRLVFINSSIDQSNGQIQLKAYFDNANRQLWPGELVSARILVRTDRDATVVPSQAILTGESGAYVYLLRSGDTVEARRVIVGPVVDGFTEIRTGLRPGDSVVTDGQSRLAPGTHVTVAPDAQRPQGGDRPS